jgi:hypothetical protein
MLNSLNFWIKQISNELNRQLNMEEINQIKSLIYSTINLNSSV